MLTYIALEIGEEEEIVVVEPLEEPVPYEEPITTPVEVPDREEVFV